MTQDKVKLLAVPNLNQLRLTPNKIENAKKLMQSMQDLFIEMTMSNRKYANPKDVINNIVDDKGKRLHVGDEEDVGEIGSRFMNSLHDAYQYYEVDSESSDEGKPYTCYYFKICIFLD